MVSELFRPPSQKHLGPFFSLKGETSKFPHCRVKDLKGEILTWIPQSVGDMEQWGLWEKGRHMWTPMVAWLVCFTLSLELSDEMWKKINSESEWDQHPAHTGDAITRFLPLEYLRSWHHEAFINVPWANERTGWLTMWQIQDSQLTLNNTWWIKSFSELTMVPSDWS